MILVDTSVWVHVLRDKSGGIVHSVILYNLNYFRALKMNSNGDVLMNIWKVNTILKQEKVLGDKQLGYTLNLEGLE